MRIPGATKRELSFSLFFLIKTDGMLDTALSAESLSRSKSEDKLACSSGFRRSISFDAPLEITIGT
jgi:hypothetical protein